MPAKSEDDKRIQELARRQAERDAESDVQKWMRKAMREEIEEWAGEFFTEPEPKGEGPKSGFVKSLEDLFKQKPA